MPAKKFCQLPAALVAALRPPEQRAAMAENLVEHGQAHLVRMNHQALTVMDGTQAEMIQLVQQLSEPSSVTFGPIAILKTQGEHTNNPDEVQG